MFKHYCFPKSIIPQAVYFKLRFTLPSLEELMQIRGVDVDHAALQHWVFKFTPLLEKEFRKKKKPVGNRCRMDGTYINVKVVCRYFYRALDK